MPLKLVLALLLVVFPAKTCGLNGVGFASWDITVTNAGPGDAMVGISGRDVNRRGVVPAGTSVSVTSLAGGSVLISASPAADVLAQMKARRDQIAAELDAKPIDLAKSIEIYKQLGQVNAEIRAYQGEEHGSQCTIELIRDTQDDDGIDVSATVSFDGSRFNLAC